MMIDWCSSMKQTFEFYIVNPSTWKDSKRIYCITSCSIDRDLSEATLGSASIDCTEMMDECYVRIYLIAIQNGITEKVPLGTFLVQTPSRSFDGKVSSITLDAYTPLIELKGIQPPVGYSILKGNNIMDYVTKLCAENMRSPVVAASSSKVLTSNFVSNLDDNWMTFVSDLITNADYEITLDELGRTLFAPVQDIASLQPVWSYDDNNSSILYPDVDYERDLYDVPNVVEVICSTDSGYITSRIVNDDPNSPTSTVSRGREVVYRESNPSLIINPEESSTAVQKYLDDYATLLLRNLSCLEHTITYTHGYCPVRLGDCVRLNYKRADLKNVKAKVISQSIRCETGCSVEETAVYTTQLWR